ncbi:MAG TPA: AAA family ATPase [Myxococcales bacterium]
MITEFHAKDYGPLKDVHCMLTPLHAFIGPNDSGKSTLLRAIVTSVNYFGGGQKFALGDHFELSGKIDELPFEVANTRASLYGGILAPDVVARARQWIQRPARVCRFDAEALRKPSTLIEEQRALEFVTNRGLGLPGVLDLLNNRADDALRTISSGMTKLFPALARIQLRNISSSEKRVAAELVDGTRIDADTMSEGILYYLAYACVRALGGGALPAVEEPETGLHPARIAEVMRILREISESGTQVIIATHNPLVINELKPSEVSVVTRTREFGTQVNLISDTPHFEERSKVYALGELWLSYANGTDEKPLLTGEEGDEA